MQHHYPPRALAIIIIPILFTALSTVMVVLRIIGRRIKRTSLWLDDYAIVAALVRCVRKILKRWFRTDLTTVFCLSFDDTHSCQWVSNELSASDLNVSNHGSCYQSGRRTPYTRNSPQYHCSPTQGGSLRAFGLLLRLCHDQNLILT